MATGYRFFHDGNYTRIPCLACVREYSGVVLMARLGVVGAELFRSLCRRVHTGQQPSCVARPMVPRTYCTTSRRYHHEKHCGCLPHTVYIQMSSCSTIYTSPPPPRLAAAWTLSRSPGATKDHSALDSALPMASSSPSIPVNSHATSQRSQPPLEARCSSRCYGGR